MCPIPLCLWKVSAFMHLQAWHWHFYVERTFGLVVEPSLFLMIGYKIKTWKSPSFVNVNFFRSAALKTLE